MCIRDRYYLVPAYFKGSYETESRHIGNVASLKVDWLTTLFAGSYINLGIFFAGLAVVFVAILLDRTVLGLSLIHI